MKRAIFLLAGLLVLASTAMAGGWDRGPWANPVYRFLTLAYEQSGENTAMTTTGETVFIPIPEHCAGCVIVDVLGHVAEKGVTGTTTMNVLRKRAGSDVSVLSTGVTIGDEWYASDGVINTAYDDLAEGDALAFTVTTIHSGTAPKGGTEVLTLICPR